MRLRDYKTGVGSRESGDRCPRALVPLCPRAPVPLCPRALVPLLLAIAVLMGSQAFGQIHPLTDQYSLNLFQLNPAVAGTERYAPLTFNTRQQWIGWDEAPVMQSVTFHTRLRSKGLFFTPQGFRNKGKNSFGKVGLGGGFFNYSYGSVGTTGMHLDYAYHMILDKGRLAFGLSPTMFQFRLNDLNRFVFPDPNDPVLSDTTFSGSLVFIDFNAGVHYYSDDAYAGLSLVQLFGSAVKFGEYRFPTTEDPSMNPDLARSFYAYGGYFFNIDRDMKIEPMVLFKYNTRNGYRFDINATFHYREVFMAGAGYRWKEGFVAFTGVRLDNFALKYLFEIPLTSKVPGRFTSHSIQLGFNLGQPIE